MNRQLAYGFVTLVIWLGSLGSIAAEERNGRITLLFSADTRGELSACTDCGLDTSLGGLARRVSLVKQVRQENPELLLVDAGNALFGADTMPSKGAVMLPAYAELGYDAVNLAYRDFRLGKEATVRLIRTGEIPFVSANLVDVDTGEPLATPYVVKEFPSGKVVILGVTQAPAGLSYLRHLQEQLAGIRIEPPEDAVAKWLPQARDETARVILLYYGSYAGLEPVRERFADHLDAILVGGSRPEYLPTKATPPVVGTSSRGQHLAKVQLTGRGPQAEAQVTQVPVELTLTPDTEIEKVLAAYQARQAKVVIGETLKVGMPLSEAMALLGMAEGMRSEGSGVEAISWMTYDSQGLAIGAKPGGKTVEVIDVLSSFRGRFAPGFQIGDSYTAVIQHHGMPASLTPERAQYPDKGLVLRFKDEKVSGARLSRVARRAEETTVPKPALTPRSASNKAVRIELVDRSFEREVAGQPAPAGKTFLVLDTRWENIHPKQKTGKHSRDITKGVGGLGFSPGARQAEDAEQDVPYKIERPLDHVFALADGFAIALHRLTDEVEKGLAREQPLTLAKHGEVRETQLVFLVPQDIEHLAFQLSDDQNGHIVIPIQGELAQARGDRITEPVPMPEQPESPPSAVPLQESEPNDEREQANALPMGKSIEGRMEGSYYDWYRLEVTAPGRNLIRVDLTGIPEVNLRLALYDAAGNRLKDVTATEGGGPESLINMGVTHGSYYVLVTSDWGSNTTDPYHLTAQLVGPWREGWEFEPNDERGKANVLGFDTPVEGLFQWPQDNDWYRLEVPFTGKSLLRIDLSGVTGADSTLALHDARGELLKESNVAEEGGAETLANIGVTQGTYYVRAEGPYRGWDASQPYRLRVQRSGAWTEGREFEPNDDQEHSNVMSLEEPITGLFQGPRDEDWYRLTISGAGTHILEVNLTAVPGVDSKIALYDAAGKELAGTDHSKRGEPETLVHVGVAEGTYYVVPYIRDYDDPNRDTSLGYTIVAHARTVFDQAAVLVEEQTALTPGYNIALAALGGKLERVTSEDPSNYMQAENLNDGASIHWHRGFYRLECTSCGWSSAKDAFPQEMVFSFHKERQALVTAVVVDTTTEDTLHNPDLIPQHVEVWTSLTSANKGFSRLAGVRLEKKAAEQLITFPPTQAKYLQIRFFSNYGGSQTQVGEVKVIEAKSTESSILADFKKDLALPGFGGVLVRFTSQWSKGDAAGELLLQHGDGGWLSKDGYLPQDFVFAFRDDRIALIDRIALNPATERDPNTRPKTISVSVTTERNPLAKFNEVGQFSLDQEAREQVFPIGQRARFLRLRILENFGGNKTSLGKVELIEGQDAGYRSILLEWPEQLPQVQTSVPLPPMDESTFLAEIEPNDTPGQANVLELNRFTKGIIDPLGEVDYFRVPLPSANRSALTLELMGRPNIRAAVALLDESGKELRHFDPGKVPADHTTFSWLVERPSPFIKLTEPPVSIVLIWDTSGSMEGSTEALQQAIEAFIDQIRSDDRLNLIRFSDEVQVLLDDFTNHKEALKSAARGKFVAEGGTALYEAVEEGIQLLEHVKGNRVIVLMTDGTDTVGELDHPAFWRLVEKKRVRLYAVGMGRGQKVFEPRLASRGARILEHVAAAMNGLALLAPTKEELKTRYQEIADALHQPASYYLKPVFSRGSGFLSVASTEEQIVRSLVPRIELILDASGSMRERKRKIDGKLKIDVAKEEITEIIEGLPDDMEVALRVYGHRIREGRRGDCQDSQLLVPFGKLNKSKMLRRVRKIRALGTTPLVYSLEQAARDFPPGPEEKIIILVTDGKEECGGDPTAAAKRLVREGFNVTVNVVGFALADEKTKQDMQRVARITKGRYYDAQDREGLRESLRGALAVPYDVVDGGGVAVGSGLTGQGSTEFPEGIYSVIIRASEEPITVPNVQIRHNQYSRVELKKEGQKISTRIVGPLRAHEVTWPIVVDGP